MVERVIAFLRKEKGGKSGQDRALRCRKADVCKDMEM
jgi:hypothetical protein